MPFAVRHAGKLLSLRQPAQIATFRYKLRSHHGLFAVRGAVLTHSEWAGIQRGLDGQNLARTGRGVGLCASGQVSRGSLVKRMFKQGSLNDLHFATI